MTLKVWRKQGKLFAECTSCGSYGTAAHVKIERRLDPEIADALEKHTAHMLTLRSHLQQAIKVLQQKVASKEMSTPDAQAKFRELSENHVKQVQGATALLPNPEGKVTFFATACPWCDAPEQADIVELAVDADPPFELVKLVVQEQNKSKGS